ncbi:MAG: cytochrome C oxidase subunit I, partial [Methylocapsa sp.]|nr:cytochrome C oxidase subunit I [Methylocapsa sp.]
SALLFLRHLIAHREQPFSASVPYRFALAVHPDAPVPSALNGFRLWNGLLAFLMAVTYGWPIVQQAIVV